VSPQTRLDELAKDFRLVSSAPPGALVVLKLYLHTLVFPFLHTLPREEEKQKICQ
jgi:hypothetical protein